VIQATNQKHSHANPMSSPSNPTNTGQQHADKDQYSYSVHKTYTTVITKARTQSGHTKWARVAQTTSGDVTVTIDLDSLAEQLARKALSSSEGKSRALNGAVRASTKNRQTKEQDLPSPAPMEKSRTPPAQNT
jgi:hypothetical protein